MTPLTGEHRSFRYRLRTYVDAVSADPAALAFLSWVFLVAGVQANNGRYAPGPLLLVVAGFVLLGVAAARRLAQGIQPVRGPSLLLENMLAAILIAAMLTALGRRPGVHIELEAYRWAYLAIYVALGIVTGLVAFGPSRYRRFGGELFLVACAVAVIFRVGMLWASPSPIIDVYAMLQESAQHLLAGLNPYTTPVSDVYKGTQYYGYTIYGYAYLPFPLYLETVGYLLAGDFRFAHIIAEVIAAAALYSVARRHSGVQVARWLTLLFLFYPRALYTLEMGWSEPLQVAAFGICNWLALRRPNSRTLAAAYGLFLSLKLYLVWFALHGLMLFRRPSLIIVAIAAGAVTVLPFAIWNFEAFVRYGIFFQLETPFRADGLTIFSAMHHAVPSFTPGKLPALIVSGAVAFYCLWRFWPLDVEGWRWATTLTTWTAFLVGSQAFANYYYFIGAMLLFLIAGCGQAGERLDRQDRRDPALAA
ncbi:MAG: hypothetical protein QOD74_2206 [Variibacter sp.]|nr:hypothetical protein [Variibacter sp.]